MSILGFLFTIKLTAMRRKIIEIPVQGKDANTVTVELMYSKGGMNYFTGDNEARGLKLHVTPEMVTDRSRSFIGFSGIKKHVLDMKRFSQKTLDEFPVDTTLVERMVDHVITKNNLTKIQA
jgi:hypothetical protein